MMARPATTIVEGAEEAPEADRLADFPHPRQTADLFGQAAAEACLLEAFRGGRMHHAWLLLGSEGVGKATLAYRFARFALAAPDAAAVAAARDLAVPAASQAFRQVAALAHPNLLVLRRPWLVKDQRLAATIPVDEVRRLKAFLGSTAGAGPWRVVIVDRADELNVNAANALLKSLEEPPARTIFLLVATASGGLPATIRSRCRTLVLPDLGFDDLRQAVTVALAAAGHDAPPPDELAAVAHIAQGSVRRALQLVQEGGVDLYRRLLVLWRSLPRLDHAGAHALAEEVAGRGADADFHMLCGLLEDLIVRLVRARVHGQELPDEEAAMAGRLGGGGGLARWAELWEEVRRAKAEAVALNLDRKHLILEFFTRLEQTARATARQGR